MTETSDQQPAQRSVRSFVRRAGRLTPGQKRALEQLWPRFGIDLQPGELLDIDQAFGRRAPCIAEIGFGNGDALVRLAAEHPAINFLGIEVHEPGVGHCLMHLEKAGIINVRLIREDAVEVLRQHLADASLRGINLFFPDPWPKKRHHKRRLVQPDFVALMAQKLAPGGEFHVATDWANYAEHIDEVMSSSEFFARFRDAARRPKTKFEQRGERLGHRVWEAVYRRNDLLIRPRRNAV